MSMSDCELPVSISTWSNLKFSISFAASVCTISVTLVNPASAEMSSYMRVASHSRVFASRVALRAWAMN